MQPHP